MEDLPRCGPQISAEEERDARTHDRVRAEQSAQGPKLHAATVTPSHAYVQYIVNIVGYVLYMTALHLRPELELRYLWYFVAVAEELSFSRAALRVGIAQREIEGVEDIEALERSEQVALAKRVALGEMGVMTVGALLILTLALRAFQTGG